jgi:ribonuclease-3
MAEPANPASLIRLARSLPSEILARALTHSSWVERRADSYERLEFLGDSVLGLAVAAHIYERFPLLEEGGLAKLKAYTVSRRSCGLVAQRLGIRELIQDVGPNWEGQGRDLLDNPTLLGNVLEALIGGCYLVYGFDATRDAVIEAFAEQVTYGLTHQVDYKSALQEYLAPSGRPVRYRLIHEEGPPHERIFTSEVLIEGRRQGSGQGTSIKLSEQRAARQALIGLGVYPEETLEEQGGAETTSAGGS